MKAKKFLVISQDSGEQQIFWDWVLAVDDEAAKAFIARHRDYTNGEIEALSVFDLSKALREMKAATPADFVAAMKERVAEFVERTS